LFNKININKKKTKLAFVSQGDTKCGGRSCKFIKFKATFYKKMAIDAVEYSIMPAKI
jgi:hypothetical protein